MTGHGVYYVYDVYYLYIPPVFVWAFGLTPFVLALIARLKHFQQLWWVSVTLIAEFVGVGIGVMVYLHHWLGLAEILATLALSGAAHLLGQRYRARHQRV